MGSHPAIVPQFMQMRLVPIIPVGVINNSMQCFPISAPLNFGSNQLVPNEASMQNTSSCHENSQKEKLPAVKSNASSNQANPRKGFFDPERRRFKCVISENGQSQPVQTPLPKTTQASNAAEAQRPPPGFPPLVQLDAQPVFNIVQAPQGFHFLSNQVRPAKTSQEARIVPYQDAPPGFVPLAIQVPQQQVTRMNNEFQVHECARNDSNRPQIPTNCQVVFSNNFQASAACHAPQCNMQPVQTSAPSMNYFNSDTQAQYFPAYSGENMTQNVFSEFQPNANSAQYQVQRAEVNTTTCSSQNFSHNFPATTFPYQIASSGFYGKAAQMPIQQPRQPEQVTFLPSYQVAPSVQYFENTEPARDANRPAAVPRPYSEIPSNYNGFQDECPVSCPPGFENYTRMQGHMPENALPEFYPDSQYDYEYDGGYADSNPVEVPAQQIGESYNPTTYFPLPNELPCFIREWEPLPEVVDLLERTKLEDTSNTPSQEEVNSKGTPRTKKKATNSPTVRNVFLISETADSKANFSDVISESTCSSIKAQFQAIV